MTNYWHPGGFWDTLRTFNTGLVADLGLLYAFDAMHPGEFVYYPDLINGTHPGLIVRSGRPNLFVGDRARESGEVRKLEVWKMAEWAGLYHAKDGNRAAYYRIVEHGKAVWRGEVMFQQDYWYSDKTLNYAYPPVFIHQVRKGFDLRQVRQQHLRSQPPGGGSSPPPPPTPPPTPTPPTPGPTPTPQTTQTTLTPEQQRAQDKFEERFGKG